MPHEVVFAPQARSDLRNLYLFIADQSGRSRAMGYLERIEAYCRTLSDFPERGTLRDDLRPGLRILGFEKRVTIAFRVVPGRVTIFRVLYGGRSLSALSR